MESIPASERVVVGEKVTHRLAQRPGSYGLLRYVRPVVKRRDTGKLLTARVPSNVLDRTSADVSLLAGMLVDKLRHHLPLHRQHRRMADAGVAVSRSSLTNWTERRSTCSFPVAAAQAAHVLERRVLAMDETPVKAGLAEPGRMRQGYFWPIYGEDDEIVFPFAPTSVYLADAEVLIDTIHLERALRPISAGRRNWLFAWTELGTQRVGRSRVCSRPARCRAWIRTRTWWTRCSASGSIPRRAPSN